MLSRIACLLLVASVALAAPAAASTAQDARPSAAGPHGCADLYPEAALRANAEGVTTLSFTIGPDGKVRDIGIDKSSGNADLDTASKTCASAWLYNPATRDGKPVAAPWSAAVEWKIHTPEYAWVTAKCAEGQTLDGGTLTTDGHTLLTYRVMPDSTIKDVKVLRSSGNAALDAVAQQCVAAMPFNRGSLDLPPEGVPGHIEIDWRGQIRRDTPLRDPLPEGLILPVPLDAGHCQQQTHAGANGNTGVEFTIGTSGQVRDIHVTSSSGSELLDKTAVACIASQHWRPAVLDFEPVAVIGTFEFGWKKKGDTTDARKAARYRRA